MFSGKGYEYLVSVAEYDGLNTCAFDVLITLHQGEFLYMSNADRFPFRESATAAESDELRPEIDLWWKKLELTAGFGYRMFGQLQVHGISHQQPCSSNGRGQQS
jgi:hypothetical protein